MGTRTGTRLEFVLGVAVLISSSYCIQQTKTVALLIL